MSRTTGTYFVMTLERAKAPAESPSPAMAAAAAYTVAEADLDRDREAILAVWRRNLPDKELAAAKFDWYYRSNPLGSGRIWKLIADSTGEIVGTAGMGRRRLKVGPESLIVGLNSDFAVDESHRSLLPAIRLQKAAVTMMPEYAALLYGLPNVNAIAVLNRVGYKDSGKIIRHAKILRSGSYLRRIPALKPVAPVIGVAVDLAIRAAAKETWVSFGGRTVKNVNGFDERFDALWQRVRSRYVIATERTADYLDWRYNQCPLREFRTVALFDCAEQTLHGYAVTYLDGRHARIADIVADDEIDLKRTLAAAVKAVRTQGAESVSLLAGEHPELAVPLLDFGFRRREDDGSSRRIITNLGPNSEKLWPQNAEREWFFLAGDEDFN